MRFPPVHWHEGLFLRAQHFQAADRAWTELVQTSEQWDHEYNYGLRSIEFSKEAIANGQFQLQACEARMRDGALVALVAGQEPDRVEFRSALRGPLDLGPALDKKDVVRVYLAAPKLKLGSANVDAKEDERKCRFHIESQQVADDAVSGMDQEIQVRRLNVRLLLDTQDMAGFEVLPIAQIRRSGAADGSPQLDASYIPPLLATMAWRGLSLDIVRAIYDLVGAQIEIKSSQLIQRGIGLAAQDPRDLENIWMLSALNSAYATLGVLAFARGIHPLQAYTELCRLAGALSICGKTRRPPEILRYDHDDLHGIFSDIKLKIEALWSEVDPYLYERRDFVGQGRGMMAALDPKWFSAEWEWYVGVFRGELSEAQCRTILEPGVLNWKLGSADQVEELFKRVMPGVALVPLGQAPRALPVDRNCSYFSVSRQGPAWSRVMQTATLAMRLEERHIGNLNQLSGSRQLVVPYQGKNHTLQFVLFAVRN